MGDRVRVAILGSGNIGTDLMVKVLRSEVLELAMVAGIDPASEGLARAREAGVTTTTEGIDGLLAEPGSGAVVFDATSAKAHRLHAPRLAEAGRIAVDLTPAAVGPYVVPGVTPEGIMGGPNLNLISCGAQATIPMVLVAALDKLGIDTGIDVFKVMDVAEDLVRPIMDRPQVIDRAGLTLGYAGVYSSFLLRICSDPRR